MRTISYSEAGRLGGQKTKLITEQKQKVIIDSYNISPNICMNCKSSLIYEKRSNKFCSRSCAAIYNNARKDWDNIQTGPKPSKSNKLKSTNYNKVKYKKRLPGKPCINCNKPTRYIDNKFCSTTCDREYRIKERIEKWLDTGIIKGSTKVPGSIRKYIFEEQNNKCADCGNSEWCGNPIPIELEHIDGNSENNSRNNLKMICPNCHTFTPTYKGKNKGNGRAKRRERYRDGKSY